MAEQFSPETDLSAHDMAVLLLTTTAELSHALLAQYLYAAYSLNLNAWVASADGTPYDVIGWRAAIVRIAKEKMGHLLSLQNLLRLLGGHLHFSRPTFPFRSAFYPFALSLQPLSKNSLARFIMAELPGAAAGQADPDVFRPGEREAIERQAAAEGAPGCLYPMSVLFESLVDQLQQLDAAAFDAGTLAWQATAGEWSRDSNDRADSAGIKVLAAGDRASAVQAVRVMAAQCNGSSGVPESAHFFRLLHVYRQFPEASGSLVLPVPTHPSTTGHVTLWSRKRSKSPTGKLPSSRLPAPGLISHPQSVAWAELFNVRYHIMLASLHHSLLLPAGSAQRAELTRWVFEEMNGRGTPQGNAGLAGLADKLAQMPQHHASATRAGAAFELPRRLTMPQKDVDRWKLHLSLIRAASSLIEGLPPDPLLASIARSDGTAADGRVRFIIQQISGGSQGAAVPGDSGPQSGPAGESASAGSPPDAPNAGSAREAGSDQPEAGNSPGSTGHKPAADEETDNHLGGSQTPWTDTDARRVSREFARRQWLLAEHPRSAFPWPDGPSPN